MKPEPYLQVSWVHLLLTFSVCVHGSGGRPESCAEIQSAESEIKSIQNCVIYPFGPEEKSVEVLCDFETDDGAWTIIQKRSFGPKDEFYRNWTDYEQGFGSVDGNFWIGLTAIHALTKDLDQELRIDLWDFEGGQAYAQFSKFSVSDASDFYRLFVDGYSGTAGDSLKYHNGMRFSTTDEDHDNWGSNCAESRRGAWWYSSCATSNLNGLYYEKGESQDPIYSGVLWDTWKNDYRSLRQVEMKIRNMTTGTTTETTTTTTMEPTTEELTTKNPAACSSGRPKNCAEIQSEASGFNSSQICLIYPFGPEEKPVEVFCDFETDGGGWTTFQKRSSGPKGEFDRGWVEYENGFGSVEGNYWLGLKAIQTLTKDKDQDLRIDLWDFDGGHAYAKYTNFYISDSSDFYRLSVGVYSGTAGDSIKYPPLSQNGMKFSTKDKDNDIDNNVFNCVENCGGAWWHSKCGRSALNGLYYEKGEPPNPIYSGMRWFQWENSLSLKQVEMKIRQHR